jgi:hypothetical protein
MRPEGEEWLLAASLLHCRVAGSTLKRSTLEV